jgi:SAM-dependent methyltransferase
MPTLEDNKKQWTDEYDWHEQGDEWSAPWGGAAMQWYGTILPRIKSHVPANRILEIACGQGRWTQYLKDLCNHLVVVDLSERLIGACRRRFADCSHIEYHVNDGKSLDMVASNSIDFVYSFDSLVHADLSVMKAYLGELQRILTPEGVAFLHHSNLGEYRARYQMIRKIPKLEGLLYHLGILEHKAWRDMSVDAQSVDSVAKEKELRCLSQEIILWSTKRTFLDCISTIARKNSSAAHAKRQWRNSNFMHEAENLLQLSRIYYPDSLPSRDQGGEDAPQILASTGK